MDGFLIDAPRASYNCNTTEDLQLQLSHLRESKVSETKAHHLSATFELPSTAVFHVPEEPEKDAPNHEPAHGSPSATPEAAVNENAQRPVREIRAHDALMNQPADDPALQRAVAKHIITSLGTVDGSFWSVRSMSRNATGWTFQYICKNSTLAWTRQHAKNTAKVLIGESSGKDGRDPINLARPAFDCRGSVTIAFVKNSRRITVKLEHTPLHKTVAELEEIYKPLLAPNRAVPAVRSAASKKRKATAANGEEGAKKKKRKKTDKPMEGQTEGQTPKPKKSRASRAKAKKKTVTPADGADDAMLNLSPSEAARRSDEAKRKLSDSGIDPATLSQEQFDIFANQSPELQHESLAMLVKYGAERLRIVHPTKDDGTSSSPAGANGATPKGTEKKKTSRKSLNPDGTPKIKKTRGGCEACKARKKKCTKGKPACNECTEDNLDCFYAPQQPRNLKGSKNKSQETAEDEPDGADESAAAELPADNSTNLPANEPDPFPAAAAMPEPEPEPEPVAEDEASDLGSPGFNSSHPPHSEVVSQEVGATVFPEVSHDMYQPGTSELSYPPAVQNDMPAGMDYSQYSHQIGQQQNGQNGMAYPNQSQQTPNASYHAPPPASEPEPVETVRARAQKAPTRASRAAARRSLPSGSTQSNNGYPPSSATSNGSAWQTGKAPASTSQAYTVPVSPRQSRTKRQAAPIAALVYDTSQSEALAAAATLSQAALRRTQPSPTARTVSPFQNPTQAAAQAARAKSRQGHRSQSRATASPFHQTSFMPAAAVSTASIYNSTGSAEAKSSASYDQYPRYNTTSTQSGDASLRAAYDAYPQQAGSTGSTAPYTGYDSYNARSQASKSTPLKAPVTHSASASYTQTAAPSTSGWSNSSGTGHRGNNSYGSNNVATSTSSAYKVPAPSTQQQSATMQSFNVRPQPTTHASRTNTPPYNAQQQPAQQSRQRQQPQQTQAYSSYSTQTHSSSTQQPSQASQQDWYGFGSSNNATPGYGSGSRSAGYGQSAQQRPAAMNISGSTYQQNMHDQEIYDMFRNPPAH